MSDRPAAAASAAAAAAQASGPSNGALTPRGGRRIPFAFAWCVGFVVVFVPAGAGVRDALLVAIPAPTLRAGSATAVALVSRVLLAVEVLVTPAAAAGFGRFGMPAS